MIYEWHRSPYTVSTDHQRLDVATVHRFLSEESYWAKGRSLEVTCKSINHSICFGLYHEMSGEQHGFARAITDLATYAYMADVFILREYRGQGLGKWLVQCVLEHPDLHGLRSWGLKTANAHGLYARYGFTNLAKPEMMMELIQPTN
jgi:GNAT superfamily N-acetyltransferase